LYKLTNALDISMYQVGSKLYNVSLERKPRGYCDQELWVPR